MANKSAFKNLILDENETLLKVVRQSGRKLLISLFLPMVLILLPFFFLFPLFYWGDIGTIIFFATLVVGIFWLIRVIVIWRFQIFIITTQRIIDIDKKGLFQKIVSDVPLVKIQDVFYEIRGIGQTLTRVGNVQITIIDSKTIIEIRNVSRPYKIQQLILQLKSDTIKEKLETTKLSAEELVVLVKKIKAGIGEEKFNEILRQTDDRQIEEK